MNNTKEKSKFTFRCWFRLCPLRHIFSLLGFLLIGAYFALRRHTELMQTLSSGFVRPWHRFVSRLCSHLSFSVAEVLIVLGILLALIYLVSSVVALCRKPDKLLRLYRVFLSCVTAFSMIYGGFCLFWGIYYYSADFESQSGIYSAASGTEQLLAVTQYFTDLVNHYDALILRNPDGSFAEDIDDIFARSDTL